MDIELEELTIESLVPDKLQSVSDPDTFLTQLPQVSHFSSFHTTSVCFSMTMICCRRSWQQMQQKQVLRYVGGDQRQGTEMPSGPQTVAFPYCSRSNLCPGIPGVIRLVV